MNAWSRGKKGYKSIYVPTKAGGLVQRSTGTKDGVVVRGMRKMVRELKDAHRWAIIDALTIPVAVSGKEKKVFRLSLGRAFQHYSSNALDVLEAELSATNLSASLDGWIAWVRANRREGVRTADVYWQQVTTLVKPGEVYPSSDLTKAKVIAWLAGRAEASSGTRRKYLYALRSFVRFLLDTGVLTVDPLAGLKAPKKNPARKRWVTADVDESIVRAIAPGYQAIIAFIKATGCDVSAALRAQKGDVNLFAKTADIRGTKTDHRAVHGAAIEAWAVPYLTAHLKRFQNAPAHTLLWPGMTRNALTKHHAYVCTEKVGVEGYTLKDSRHSVGVRMRKAGRTFEEIAAQLGTSVYQVVQVYSVHTPDQAEQQQEAK